MTNHKANLEAALKKGMEWLASGTRRNPRQLTNDEIASLLEISTSTVNRWIAAHRQGEEAVGPEDEHIIRRLIWLREQAENWYMRVCPFALVIWMPNDNEQLEQIFREEQGLGGVFEEVTFKPAVEGSAGSNVLSCQLKIRNGVSFRNMSFFSVSQRHGLVSLSRHRDGTQSHIMRYMYLEEGKNTSGTLKFYVHYQI